MNRDSLSTPQALDSAEGLPSARALIPPVWFLAACTAIAVVGLTILTPLIPLISEDLQISSAQAQSLLTIYLVAISLSQLVCGPVSDRFGRRPLLLAGTLIFALGGLVMTVSRNFELLCVSRILQGAGAGASMAMVRAMINDVFERSDAARQMSTISMILAVAPALAMSFSGAIARSGQWQITMAFLGLCGLCLYVMAVRRISETNLYPINRINLQSIRVAYQTVLSSVLFLCWTLTSGMQVGIFFVLNGILAYEYQRLGYSMTEFGLWFSLTPLSYLVGNYANRVWFVARGLENSALFGCLLSLSAMLGLLTAHLMGFTHALSLALPCCLFGFSNGIVIANSTIGAISVLDRHIGTATGIVGAWQMATGGLAGMIIVLMGGAEDFKTAVAALLAMSLVSVLSMLAVRRKVS